MNQLIKFIVNSFMINRVDWLHYLNTQNKYAVHQTPMEFCHSISSQNRIPVLYQFSLITRWSEPADSLPVPIPYPSLSHHHPLPTTHPDRTNHITLSVIW